MTRGLLYAEHRAAGATWRDMAGTAVATSFGDRAGEYLALRRDAGLSDLSHLGMAVVTGPERISFLQSIVSQDVAPLEEEGGFARSLLLSPKGKVEFGLWLFAAPGDRVLAITEAGSGAELAAALGRWRIRVKCDITDGDGEWGLQEIRGPQAASFPGVAWDWPGLPGRLLALPSCDVRDAWTARSENVRPVGWDAREMVRVEAGVPRIGGGLDADESTIPQEAFLDRDLVSFDKGCFLGQELVCRIDSRGHVNRYLRGFVVGETVVPPEGAEVRYGAKAVGRVTSVAESLDLRAPVALGYLRREVDVPAAVTLVWDDGEAAAEARVLPLIG